MSDDRRVMPPTPAVPTHEQEPPVVARLIVEIRSDGSRTIARGAIEDTTTGQRTAVEAHGSTPLALIASLTKSIFQLPTLARQAARALLSGRHPGDVNRAAGEHHPHRPDLRRHRRAAHQGERSRPLIQAEHLTRSLAVAGWSVSRLAASRESKTL